MFIIVYIYILKGPLSPQSTLHAISSATSKLKIPIAIEVVKPMQPVAIGIDEIHIGDEVGPILVHAVQAQSILTSNETLHRVIVPEENNDQQTMVVQPLPGHVIMVQSRFIQNQDPPIQVFQFFILNFLTTLLIKLFSLYLSGI